MVFGPGKHSTPTRHPADARRPPRSRLPPEPPSAPAGAAESSPPKEFPAPRILRFRDDMPVPLRHSVLFHALYQPFRRDVIRVLPAQTLLS